MTTAGNTDPVDRVPARIAWTASPSITLTYLADDDALLVDVLPGTSRAEVDRHGGLSIGLDGGDPLALPVCVCLVGFASTRGPAARLAREYLGEEIWRHATGLPTDADSDTWFVLTESAKTDALARWAAFAHREFGDVAGLRTLALPAAGKVRDVFISHAQEDRAVMTAFAEQLAEAGLDVFMDDTSRPRPDALASAKVFLAYSSATHPRLPAGLWSLLAAHRAAGAHGHRVLTVDPDTAPRGEVDLLHRVRESVALVDAPFGPTGDDVGADGFVGRLAELVRVHEALRDDGSVVLVRGADGIGKTSLVERYAALFRAVFPGGVHWTGRWARAATTPRPWPATTPRCGGWRWRCASRWRAWSGDACAGWWPTTSTPWAGACCGWSTTCRPTWPPRPSTSSSSRPATSARC